MTSQIKLIPDISPGQSSWTAKVVVAEKTMARTGQHSPVKYQNMVLVDPQGNKVHATIYNNDITAFQNTLLLSKTYLLSNATVRHTDPKYKPSVGPVQWTINGRTRIEELDENHDALIFSTYDLVSFDRLQEHMDSKDEIAIVGLAIDMLPKKVVQTKSGGESYIKEVILINERFETVMLRMWDRFVDTECNKISELLNELPVIIGKNLRVSSFNGMAVSTKSNSSILINPSFQGVHHLRTWADEHVDRITDLIAKKSYMVPSTSITIRPPAKHQVIQIKDIPSFISGQEDQHFFWVKGRLNIELLQQSYWYMCCSICNKSSHVDFDELYQCFYCKCDGAKGKPRAKAYVQVIDCTGSIDATMIGETAESYLQCPATTLMDLTASQNDMSISHAIRSSIDEACFVYIRATKKDTSGVQVKYDAVFLLDSTDELDTPTRCENTSNSSVVSHKDHLSWTKENKGIVMPLKRTLFSLKDIGSSEDEDCEINAIKNIPDCFTQNRGLDVDLDSADEDSLPTVLNRSTNAEDEIYP